MSDLIALDIIQLVLCARGVNSFRLNMPKNPSKIEFKLEQDNKINFKYRYYVKNYDDAKLKKFMPMIAEMICSKENKEEGMDKESKSIDEHCGWIATLPSGHYLYESCRIKESFVWSYLKEWLNITGLLDSEIKPIIEGRGISVIPVDIGKILFP